MEVRRLPNFLTGFDATCILWVVEYRLILSVIPGRSFCLYLFCLQFSFDRAVCLGDRFKSWSYEIDLFF